MQGGATSEGRMNGAKEGESTFDRGLRAGLTVSFLGSEKGLEELPLTHPKDQ